MERGAIALSRTGLDVMKFWIQCQCRIPSLQTEYELLLYLLEGRVFSVDLWELLIARNLETREEYFLQTPQLAYDSKTLRRAELCLMEKKRYRAQIEVSLCTQAIGTLQELLDSHHQPRSRTSPISETISSKPHASFHPPTMIQDKCTRWLASVSSEFADDPFDEHQSFDEDPDLTADPQHHKSLFIASVSSGVPSALQQFTVPDCPSVLVSGWVDRKARQAYDDARGVELACREELMPTPRDSLDALPEARSPELESRVLRTRMYRARAEVLLFSQAIERANEFETTDGGSSREDTTSKQHPEPDSIDSSSEISSEAGESTVYSDFDFPPFCGPFPGF
ncbi:hypothetical protein BV22DRAFT_1040676 [Leucogyrophana mollusca]|uniref:Uncharacterized protein n=1 Tax=Leucogyrophana mollusca TaxID=85980 RepID=A0ACB8B1X7_9AGAM|nr:hypothetical protein BV22DRAFT_1040676 [Leucogyrophana mollusca]